MCFPPQRRVLFRHGNFYKSAPELRCFVHFDFEMCFAPATACTFSTSQLLKVLRSWGVLYILISKCASRHYGVHFFDIATSKSAPNVGFFLSFFTCKCASCHNGVHFFISHLARWLRTRRFREPTFRPSGATNHWKNPVFRDFPTFSRIWASFFLTLSLLWSSLFYSSLLSDSSRLCFSSVDIVGSLTSKLPSTTRRKFRSQTSDNMDRAEAERRERLEERRDESIVPVQGLNDKISTFHNRNAGEIHDDEVSVR